MTISNDDRKEFAAATVGVRPLKARNAAEEQRKRPAPRAKQSRAARAAVLEESLQGPEPQASSVEVSFRRDNLSPHAFRKLRRGEFSIEAEIDLHGMRLDEARAALREFMTECVRTRLACIRIVHGKGIRSGPEGPILKPSVHHWLSRWDQVLAFVSAQPRHGGSGAVYVLLNR